MVATALQLQLAAEAEAVCRAFTGASAVAAAARRRSSRASQCLLAREQRRCRSRRQQVPVRELVATAETLRLRALPAGGLAVGPGSPEAAVSVAGPLAPVAARAHLSPQDPPAAAGLARLQLPPRRLLEQAQARQRRLLRLLQGVPAATAPGRVWARHHRLQHQQLLLLVQVQVQVPGWARLAVVPLRRLRLRWVAPA